jgi:DNA helicase-2/ATP-dependent DNA helicase PcrA
MMVLAGPGSGKTRVIVHRVCFLIQEKQIPPENILVITFTKAAAVEMRQRYLQMAPPRGSHVAFSTFHAIFFTILKHAYHYTAGNILREEVRYQILKEITDNLDMEIPDESEFIHDIGGQISKIKGDRISLEQYYSPSCPEDVFRDVYKKYEKELQRRRLLDFDDMLLYCYELLEQRPDIRRLWQQQYPFILIDEFQDINQVQYDVVKLLTQPENNLFAVGDDDQSIYGFRGAKPDIMQQFIKEFSPEQCVLNVNYRSTDEIIEAAGRVIVCNKNRLAKEIIGTGKSASGGNGLQVQKFLNMSDQNGKIREEISSYHNQGIPYREMAVLFRTNTQARAITSKLKEYNIPFITKEIVPNLYDHWIAWDILSYIRVALGNRERGNVMRIINRPKRYVHRNAFTQPYVDLEELKLFYEDKDWMVDRLDALIHDLKMIAKMRPYNAVVYIRRGVEYDEYIREYSEYRGIPCENMYEILDELQEEAKQYRTFEEWFAHIEAYREELKKQIEKSKNLRSGKNREEDAVMIMTMHGSKGLEFECVFIPDANAGVIPHNKAIAGAALEEERRLFYVAMTRAKSHLHIYYLKERFNKEMLISRFVEEVTGDSEILRSSRKSTL